MNVVPKKSIINFSLDALSVCASLMAIWCVFLSFKKIKSPQDDLNIFAAKSIFPRQNKNNFLKPRLNFINSSENSNYTPQSENQDNNSSYPQKSDMNLPEFNNNYSENNEKEEGPTHKIIECQVGSGGTKCENFYVKNTTGENVNFDAELKNKPEINIKNTSDPQVLIFHTHTSESYMSKDLGFFYESFYPRSLDSSKNVTRVGQAIADKLSENGIGVIHDETYHDNPTYNGSYSRSAETVKNNLKNHPSIQVVIDIHRDSLGTNESGKIKPTFKYGDKKAAQLMIISGCDPDGSLGFPNWRKNLKLALRLQKYCESMFPGITRPLNFAKVKYNEIGRAHV